MPCLRYCGTDWEASPFSVFSRSGSSFAVILRAGAAARARKVLHKADTGLKNQDKIALPTRIRCARRHRGTPGEGSPHKNIPPEYFAPLLRFCKEKNFAPCAERPKVSPLDSTAFEKAGEILLSGRRFAKTFRFFCPTESFSYPYNRNSAKLLSGQASKEIIARPARICSAAARAAIHSALARACAPKLK